MAKLIIMATHIKAKPTIVKLTMDKTYATKQTMV
jgi:hypothetical protein